ncbi:MAG: putative polyketide biosynthesis zinc-dependent hydrolase BaeB [Deltaproteobacteria bacterium ADurb.Bin135]|jgi:glyoxylase-like metal-dependent hydrolase (beta-lactamase superfamily II)|nr:MAG: putative polyketide biosynthesis zinc-dependent hydrolase BaeB [Deltaproteobacteria bacterium ADurb.Bin135]HOD79400.1 MBL fold metallo-hydrolase [Syntrophorhabdus sp.]
MKVVLLNKNNTVYTSNAYLVLGNWNRLEDINTLIDVGADGSIISEIENVHSGVGKNKVDQIILTHNHFDHTKNLAAIKKQYNTKVYAFSPGDFVDELLKDGQMISIADMVFQVIHTPNHSSDSICLYCEEEGVLFSGDAPLRITSISGSYSNDFIRTIERLHRLNIRTIYSGHDLPLKKGVKEMLEMTLKNVKTARLLMMI